MGAALADPVDPVPPEPAMRSFVFLLLLASILGVAARAEQLYRCVTPQGAVSYQALPCAGAARLTRVVEYRPDPSTPPIMTTMHASSHASPHAALAIRPPGYRRWPVPRIRGTTSTAAQRCRAARDRREATLRQLGLKRTYTQLSRLDADVRAACPRY